jgi:hypothetical protein
MALGDLIVEDNGKVTAERILDTNGPKIETSMKMVGKYRGVETIELVTYWSIPTQGGALYGEGKGVISSKDGKDFATWTGQGVGKLHEDGKTKFHGSIFFRTSQNGGSLTYLNNLVGVFEFESDDKGNCSSKVWEWK